MKKIRLVVEKRELCGSSVSGRLRKNGFIPAVVYGHSGAKHLQILKSDFRKMMQEKGESASLIELVLGNETLLAVMQASQRNPRKDDFLHVDFKEIDLNKEMISEVPLTFIGEPAGVKDGSGILDIARHKVLVSCLPNNLPEFIKIDISNLEVGQSIHVKNLPQTKEVSFKTPSEDVIVACVKLSESDETASDEEAEPAAEAEPDKK